MRALLGLVVLVGAFGLQALAQDAGASRLFAKFDVTTCEDLNAQLHDFYQQILSRKGSRGYAVIHGANADPRRFMTKSFILGWTNFEGFDKDRLAVVQGGPRTDADVEFWLVPAGGDASAYHDVPWSYPLTAAEVFYDSSKGSNTGECRTAPDLIFRQIVESNPGILAQVVIAEPTKQDFKRRVSQFEQLLANVPPERLIYQQELNASHNYQLWLLPVR
jgi:hypothetical protein